MSLCHRIKQRAGEIGQNRQYWYIEKVFVASIPFVPTSRGGVPKQNEVRGLAH